MSIARLAQHLGLSESTVSRALNDYPDIAVKTRERVATAARDLGYRPSTLARRLARGVIETVAFVLPARTAHFTEPFVAELLDGLAAELAAHDWDLIVAAIPDGHDEIEVMDRLVLSAKVGSFVVTRTRRQDPRIDYLRASGLPFVVHGRTEDCEDYSWIDVDNEKAFVDLVRFLTGLGHQRIALLGGDAELNFAFLRRQGYHKAMGEAGLDVPAGYVVEGLADGEGGAAAMATLLAHDRPPSAVMCVTDAVAIGAMRAVARAGLTVGREISVVGYDGLPTGAVVEPPLTTMSQGSYDAGREVGRMVLALNAGQPREVTHRLWEATLTLRASANPPVEWPAKRSRGGST